MLGPLSLLLLSEMVWDTEVVLPTSVTLSGNTLFVECYQFGHPSKLQTMEVEPELELGRESLLLFSESEMCYLIEFLARNAAAPIAKLVFARDAQPRGACIIAL